MLIIWASSFVDPAFSLVGLTTGFCAFVLITSLKLGRAPTARQAPEGTGQQSMTGVPLYAMMGAAAVILAQGIVLRARESAPGFDVLVHVLSGFTLLFVIPTFIVPFWKYR